MSSGTPLKRSPLISETRRVHVWPFRGKTYREEGQRLIGEEPLSLSIDGKPYSVIMRTPGEENFLMAGFCLSEGIVNDPDDITDLQYCEDADHQRVALTLHPERRHKVSSQLKERGRQIGGGTCGEALISELRAGIDPIPQMCELSPGEIGTCLDTLCRHQKLRAETRASHAAGLFDQSLELIAMSEDVGRHNALDKAVGKAFIARDLDKVRVGVLSSRLSFEMVQKAARARIPILVGMSRPTVLAVQLAADVEMTIACDNKKGGLSVYGGFGRIVKRGESSQTDRQNR